jgi:hypothetical protein
MENLLLGLISILVYIAVLLLIGAVIVWLASAFGWPVPQIVQRIYMGIVALVALYLLVALLLGHGVPLPIFVR